MRSIWTIGVTLAAMVLLIGVMPASQHSMVRAQDAAEPLPAKMEIQTYDISDLVVQQPSIKEIPSPIAGTASEVDPNAAFCGTIDRDTGIPYADRVEQVMDLIKNSVSRDTWIPVGLTNSMQELNGVLFINAPASDHQAIATFLAAMRSAANHRTITVQWLVLDIPTTQLNEIRKRFADGGLLISPEKAILLLEALDSGKLQTTPITGARIVCMNKQKAWVDPMEERRVPDDNGDKPTMTHFYGSHFKIEPTLTADNANIYCSTVVGIAVAPTEEKLDNAELRTYQFQSTVLIPNGGGVLMTAANHKTTQAGREVVLFLQVAAISPPGAGADAHR